MFSRGGNGTKREGGFSHVAVRSCAPEARRSLVLEPRLLRPSITLTPGDRGMENGARGGGHCWSGSTLEKRKFTLNFQGDRSAHFLLVFSLALFHGMFPIRLLPMTNKIALSPC